MEKVNSIKEFQMDFQEQINEIIKDTLSEKLSFDILLVSDENSRLSVLRGYNALAQFRNFYGTMATVNLTSMTTGEYLRVKPDLHNYNVLWMDNVVNPQFIASVSDSLREYEDEVCDGPMVIDGREESDLQKESEQRRTMRNLRIRAIYALDEFVWDAPAGRQVNMFTVRMVEDAMIVADEIVVPNAEMVSVLKKVGLVPPDKDVVVINTFVNDTFYPIHKVFTKSSNYSTQIRRPKILIKGTTIPMNVQKFIMMDEVNKSYDITISSVGELAKPIYKLMQRTSDGKPPRITTIPHWANPVMNRSNYASTMAIERDMGFDFVITTIPDDIENNPYELTNLDTDNILAVAEGAVTIAGVLNAGFSKENHICVATNLVFGPKTTEKELQSLIERWRICTNWDTAYQKQRDLLATKTVSSEQIMGGYFHVMLGHTLSDAFGNKLKEALDEQKKMEKETK